MSIIIYLVAWFVTNPSVRHFVSEFAGRALSGQSESLKNPSDKDADKCPKDEKDHGSDNKKVDRGQRPSLSMDTPTVMQLRESNEQKLNQRGGMSHDASWYAWYATYSKKGTVQRPQLHSWFDNVYCSIFTSTRPTNTSPSPGPYLTYKLPVSAWKTAFLIHTQLHIHTTSNQANHQPNH